MASISTGLPLTSSAHDTVVDYPVNTSRARLSWGPILMGVVTAIGTQFVLTVLGIALGASAGDTTSRQDGSTFQTMGTVAALWWLVSGTVSLAIGGFVLGRMSGLTRSLALSLEAIAMWAVVALFGFMVIWSGAGMLSQAISPTGALSTPSSDRSMSSTRQDQSFAASGTDTARGYDDANTTRAEEARRATRTASWWALFGLLAGIGAAVGGAAGGASHTYRTRTDTHRADTHRADTR